MKIVLILQTLAKGLGLFKEPQTILWDSLGSMLLYSDVFKTIIHACCLKKKKKSNNYMELHNKGNRAIFNSFPLLIHSLLKFLCVIFPRFVCICIMYTFVSGRGVKLKDWRKFENEVEQWIVELEVRELWILTPSVPLELWGDLFTTLAQTP